MNWFLKVLPVLLAVAVTGSTVPTEAKIVSLKGHYGLSAANPKDLNDGTSGFYGINFPALKKLSGYGADLVIDLPFIPFGFGVRYESWADKLSAPISGYNAGYSADLTRTAFLIEKFLVSTGLLLGVNASYGVSHTNRLDLTATSTDSYKSESTASYSFGVEAGFSISWLMAGVELGYMSLIGKEYKDASGSYLLTLAGDKMTVDLSGTYTKLFLGFGF